MAEDDALKKAKDKCYTLLAYRARTVHELQTRLASAGFEASVIEAALTSLAAQNLLNDRLFAREWIAGRLATKAVGSGYLWAELLQKGVDREIIAGELLAYDDDCQYETALRLAYGKMKPGAAIEWRRLEGLLLRRGFGRSVINKVYRTIVEGGVEGYCSVFVDPQS